MEILEWRLFGHDPGQQILPMKVTTTLNGKETSYTWRPRYSKEGTAKRLTCSGELFFDVVVFFSRSHFLYSFGMMILETASNIVVPDQLSLIFADRFCYFIFLIPIICFFS